MKRNHIQYFVLSILSIIVIGLLLAVLAHSGIFLPNRSTNKQSVMAMRPDSQAKTESSSSNDEAPDKADGSLPSELPVLESGKDLATSFSQKDTTSPLVVEVPLNDQSVKSTESNNLENKIDNLMRRMAEAGVILSRDAAEQICIPIYNESITYYGVYTWVKYYEFDILIFKFPTGEGKADTFYVFENDVYKGYVDHRGAIDAENCIVAYGDDVWLSATRFFGGPTRSHAGQSTFWYRLTSQNLDCELQFTSEFRRERASAWVDYFEQVIDVKQDIGGQWTVTTSWDESLSDDWQSRSTFQFIEEGSNTYSLTPISPDDELQYKTVHSHMYLLTKHYDNIMQLIASGTPEQKSVIYNMVSYALEQESANIRMYLPELYQWYEQYQLENPEDNG